jgi:hypothetical protein
MKQTNKQIKVGRSRIGSSIFIVIIYENTVRFICMPIHSKISTAIMGHAHFRLKMDNSILYPFK